MLLCLGAATFVLYRYAERLRTRRALVQQYCCKEVPRYAHIDRVGGSDLVRLRQEAMKQGKLMLLYEEQFATYGKTFEENFLGRTVINTMHSENIQQVATSLFDNFARNPGNRIVGWPFIGKGVTTTDGADWKYSRNIVKPIFARSELSDIKGLGVFVDRLIERIPKNGTAFDIQILLHKLVRIRNIDTVNPHC